MITLPQTLKRFCGGKSFVIVFILTNVFFIFLTVYKHNMVIRLSYEEQRIMRERELMEHKKAQLSQELSQLSSLSSVKKVAQKQGMKALSLHQIKKLT